MDKEQILYEDHEIIVCYKPAGTATQTAKVGQPDMVSEVANYLRTSEKNMTNINSNAVKCTGRRGAETTPYVGLVHRLDQPVEGLLVFGKNPRAAKELSRQITENRMEKYYYAIVNAGKLPEQQDMCPSGTLVDYLYKDAKTNTSRIVSKETQGAKRAELSYKVIKQMPVKEVEESCDAQAALVEVKLVTGRHHQIRVQTSHAGMSLFGDYKYADERTRKISELLHQKQIALCAYKLCFYHPATGKRLTFQKEPEGFIFRNFF